LEKKYINKRTKIIFLIKMFPDVVLDWNKKDKQERFPL